MNENEDKREVRAALQGHLGDNETEIQRMLARYEGRHRTIRGFFRRWIEARLAEQAEWMLDYINVELIADAAVALGRVVTLDAAPRSASRSGLHVFLHKP